ncbi:uncharacterized protein LOC133204800 [Saccostrea echinata]|uniref:uncharacterized protein LOC133204800 n=1 Tax=Saccostrea echinata TaxID=191078 RepID=UPI002A7F757A|nr:uncharacterized protein LOC133204800 [Saccostrea echinata]
MSGNTPEVTRREHQGRVQKGEVVCSGGKAQKSWTIQDLQCQESICFYRLGEHQLITSNQDFSNREGVAPNHDASVKYQRHEDTDSDREPKPVCVSSLTPAESTPKETSGKAFPRPRHLKKELCQRWKAVEDVNTKNGSRKAKSSVLGDGHKRRGPYQASSVRKNPLVTTDLHSTQRKEETSGSLNSPPKQKGSETDEKTKPVCVSDYDEMKGTKRSRPISPFRPNKKWKPSKDYCRYERKVKRLIRCFRKFSIDG